MLEIIENLQVKHTLKGIKSSNEILLDGDRLDPGCVMSWGYYWNIPKPVLPQSYFLVAPSHLALAIMIKLAGKADGYQALLSRVVNNLPRDKDFEIEFEL
jgi:hypothetical protein